MHTWVRAAVLIQLAACGRLAFDQRGDAGPGDAGADGPLAMGRSLACTDDHACAVTAGTLRCWGGNDQGQLGTGDTTPRSTATVIAPERTWTQVATGVVHTCAVDSDGALFCWGGNDQGQLGVGDLLPRLVPAAVALPAAVQQLDAHQRSTCAVLVTGALYCWGDNAEGQLAQADLVGAPDSPSPLPVASSESWTSVAAGQAHILAIAASGVLWGAGRNNSGELGLGATGPTQPRSLRQGAAGPWRVLSAGQNQSCGVDLGGRLYCWGGNTGGQLGTGDLLPRDVPFQISADTMWTDVSIHTFSACAIASGALACWGRGIEGQLGTGDLAERLTPFAIGAFADWVEIEVGRFFACAMRVDGSVWCTGANGSGQLATGDTNPRREFTQVTF